jgi:hypothetical protein
MANGDGTGTAIVHGNGGIGAGMTRSADGLGGSALVRAAETNASAAAELAKANVLARFQMARLQSRDLDEVRVRILKECRRPGFAEVARYSMPRGGKRIEGPSIRMAEVCARYMGNLAIESPVFYEDDEKRLVRCSVTDLESNVTYSSDLTIMKVVERKNAEPSEVIGARRNSQGETVYLVRASDDALLQKHNALVSKTIRTLIFRVVPGDIVDEAEAMAMETLRARDKQDPDAQRKKLVDAFAGINVMPQMLKEYLEHDVGTSSESEIQHLRELYVAIKEGHASWSEIMASKKKAAEGEQKPAATRAGRVKSAAAAAAAKARGEEPASAPTHEIDEETGEVIPSQAELEAARSRES